jgi:hypothetical protein
MYKHHASAGVFIATVMAFVVLFGILFLVASAPAKPAWEHRVGDRVQHVTGVQAVVTERSFNFLDPYDRRYFIRYRTDKGSLETRHVTAEELSPMED